VTKAAKFKAKIKAKALTFKAKAKTSPHIFEAKAKTLSARPRPRQRL
jgi:hypothetical protein